MIDVLSKLKILERFIRSVCIQREAIGSRILSVPVYALVYSVDGKVRDVLLFDSFEKAALEQQKISIESDGNYDCEDDETKHESVIFEACKIVN